MAMHIHMYNTYNTEENHGWNLQINSSHNSGYNVRKYLCTHDDSGNRNVHLNIIQQVRNYYSAAASGLCTKDKNNYIH